MTPLLNAAGALEIAFCVAGIVLILWLTLSDAGRARLQIRLPEWPLPPIDFACYLCCGFVGCLILTSVVGFLVKHAHLGADLTTLLSPVAVDGGFLVGLAAFHFMYSFREAAGTGPVSLPAALKSGVLTFLIATPVLYASLWISELLLARMGIPVEKQSVVDLFESMRSPPLQWCFVALAVTIVPAAEEMVFRGGLFRYFRTRMPRWVAILTTSILFGAAHVGWGDHLAGLVSFLPLIVLSVVYCLAYERTGSIGTTIVAHGLFNLNMTLLILAGVGT
jgi:membrane protease YdiL (CAAX protease family)